MQDAAALLVAHSLDENDDDFGLIIKLIGDATEVLIAAFPCRHVCERLFGKLVIEPHRDADVLPVIAITSIRFLSMKPMKAPRSVDVDDLQVWVGPMAETVQRCPSVWLRSRDLVAHSPLNVREFQILPNFFFLSLIHI